MHPTFLGSRNDLAMFSIMAAAGNKCNEGRLTAGGVQSLRETEHVL